MVKNILKKNRVVIISVTVIATLALLFALLRSFHIILRVGDSYKLCFSTEYRVDGNWNVNDDTISEITFMKNLKHFAALYTRLTNIDFITYLTKLESLSVCGNPDDSESIIKSIPILENFSDLKYVYLYNVDVENLDFISNCTDLKSLTVKTYSKKITDISGLKNKQGLKFVDLRNVHCSDYSVLLELPSLEYLDIYDSEIPIDIKKELLNKNVEINDGELIEP